MGTMKIRISSPVSIFLNVLIVLSSIAYYCMLSDSIFFCFFAAVSPNTSTRAAPTNGEGDGKVYMTGKQWLQAGVERHYWSRDIPGLELPWPNFKE